MISTMFFDPIFQELGILAVLAALMVLFTYVQTGRLTPDIGFLWVALRPRSSAERRQTQGREPNLPASLDIWADSSGRIQGHVLRGPCKGRWLDDLSREDCEAQGAYLRDRDRPSAVKFDQYMRQRYSQEQSRPRRAHAVTTRAEALAELGLGEEATQREIHLAYRQAMRTHHPDRGGSHFKAARLNAAKAILEV